MTERHAHRLHMWIFFLVAVLGASILLGSLNRNEIANFFGADAKQEELKKSAQKSLGSELNLAIEYDAETKTAKLTQSETVSSAEPSEVYLEITYRDLVKFGAEAFKIVGVDVVTVSYTTNSEGTSNRKWTEISMTKSNFAAVDWSKYAELPCSAVIKERSSSYFIDPLLIPLESTAKLNLQ